MPDPWRFEGQLREDWPQWLQAKRVGEYHTGVSTGPPEHLLIHNGDKRVTAWPGDTLQLEANGNVTVTRAPSN
jgi:hypothetical protein